MQIKNRVPLQNATVLGFSLFGKHSTRRMSEYYASNIFLINNVCKTLLIVSLF